MWRTRSSVLIWTAAGICLALGINWAFINSFYGVNPPTRLLYRLMSIPAIGLAVLLAARNVYAVALAAALSFVAAIMLAISGWVLFGPFSAVLAAPLLAFSAIVRQDLRNRTHAENRSWDPRTFIVIALGCGAAFLVMENLLHFRADSEFNGENGVNWILVISAGAGTFVATASVFLSLFRGLPWAIRTLYESIAPHN